MNHLSFDNYYAEHVQNTMGSVARLETLMRATPQMALFTVCCGELHMQLSLPAHRPPSHLAAVHLSRS